MKSLFALLSVLSLFSLVAVSAGKVILSVATKAFDWADPLPMWLRHQIQTVSLIAFRIIERLKPVYKESYETNGMSLQARC